MKTRNVILVIVTSLICFIIGVHVFWSESTKAAKHMAEGISRQFKEAFNVTPIITVNNRVVSSEAHPISELATASKMVGVDTTYTTTWLHSTKSISIHGEFLAKAGFNLNDRLKIDISTHPKMVTVTLPNPRILSVEMTFNEITDQKGGLVNWLSPQDHEAALAQLTDAAKLEITKSSIREAAKQEMERRVRDISALKDVPVVIRYDSELPLPEKAKD